jgi:hypothetical protein
MNNNILYISITSRLILLKMFQTKVVEKIKKHVMFNNFFLNHVVYETM